MNPGHALDALIAEKVMSLPKIRFQKQGYHNDLVYGEDGMAGIASAVPRYSTDIAAAWEVVEKFAKETELKGGGPMITVSHDGEWHCDFGGGDGRLGGGFVAKSKSAPHAICMAALKAVEK